MGTGQEYSDLLELSGVAMEGLRAVTERVQGTPVQPTEAAVSALSSVAGSVGEHGVGSAAALEEFTRVMIPASQAIASPRYVGLINSTPLPVAVWADTLVAALNNNLGASHQSPAATVAETEVVRAFGDLVGWENPGGSMVSGGSMATLTAMLLMRQKYFPNWRVRPGAGAEDATMYASSSSHFSVAKALRIAGFADESLRSLTGGPRGGMQPEALRAAIETDLAAGRRPTCVVATLGTTGTGAIDALNAIADVCKTYGLWLHVDACYGGASLLLPELRHLTRGIERADSVAIDPHKWFFLPLVNAILLTPHRELETRAFAVDDASYIPGHGTHAYDRGIYCSRRASSLTLWTALRAHGWSELREVVRRNIRLTRHLESRLDGLGFEVLGGGELSTACARFVPPAMDADAVDRLQDAIARASCDSGETWFATTRHDGKTWLRFNIVNLHTAEADVNAIADLVRDLAASLTSHSSTTETHA